MLDDLVSVIETLKQRIHDHGTSLRANETRTRMALIDPLLATLGWDVSDPSVVTPEYNVSGRWADYALLRPNGQPAATLEAKKLGESLASHRMQMLNYSNASGVEYAGLTDGNHWELYEVFQRGQLEDRRILDVSIADTPAHQCALQLLLLWRANLASGQPEAASEPILFRAEEPNRGNPPPPPTAQGWVALSEYNPAGGASPPSTIRFSDGQEKTIQRWYEVLTMTVEWLYSKQLLTPNDVPINSSNRRYLVNTRTVHPDGSQFRTHRTINGTSLVVQVHGSASAMRQNTKKLLEHCGVSPNSVQLQVGE